MNLQKIGDIDDSKLFRVATPIKKLKGIIKEPLIIGFAIKGEPLSIQFVTDKAHKFVLIERAEENSKKKLSKEEFDYHLKTFTRHELGYQEIPKDINLIGLNNKENLSNFEDSRPLNPQRKAKAMIAKFKIMHNENTSTVYIKDFKGIQSDPSKASEIAGINRFELNVDGKDNKYWENNLPELHKKFPDVFKEYILREAEAIFKAYIKIRNFFIENYGTDILHPHLDTLPGVAGYIFRKDYFKEALSPTKVMYIPKSQKKGRPALARVEIYDGSYDVRMSSFFAYRGGRIETFRIGIIEDEDLAYYDVTSLYPSACMLQPIPCKTTKWINLREANRNQRSKLLREGQGFIELEFDFNEHVNYPCLPVDGIRDKIVYYPASGISYCTLEEFRFAKKLGLKSYKILSGYGFFPTIKECNHPLKTFMEDMLAKKNNSIEGSVDYEMYKLLMNSLIGKLHQKTSIDKVSESGEKGKKENKQKKLSVSTLWMPEASALILGKARAIIAQFVAKGAYSVSTDAVLLPKSTSIECPALYELRSVGSDLKHELDVNHGVLIKPGVYVLNPMEEDEGKRRMANSNIPNSKKKEFLTIIREGFKTKSIPDLRIATDQGIKEINIKYDGKREPFNPISNPFAMSTWTSPLTKRQVHNNPHRRPKRKTRTATLRIQKKQKNQKTPSDNILRILRLYESGKSQTEIAKELNYSRQYIYKVVKQNAHGEYNSVNLKKEVV